MGLTAVFLVSSLLALLISSPVIAKSPPAPILPPTPSPAPAPAPEHANLTDLFTHAGPFHTFLNYLEETQVIETFQNQANTSEQGITIFCPKDSAFASLKQSTFSNLTQDELKTLLLYHALPKYYSVSEIQTGSYSNPLSTFAGGQYTVNITNAEGLMRVISQWSQPKISSSVYSTNPVAVYEIDHVLLPLQIFSTDPPLAPAPAPAPDITLADLAPSPEGSPKSPKGSNTESSSHSIGVGLLNSMVLAASGVLVLIL